MVDIRVSIVIPALNEEIYLPKLLKSIARQDFDDYEVIVADAGSKDRTIGIAKQHGAIVVKGGLPSIGRNSGARAARGEYIFFLDADVLLPKGFLKNAYNEMHGKKLCLSTCRFKPLSKLKVDRMIHDFGNVSIRLLQFSNDPHAPGFCILAKKDLFDEAGGFDETVKIAEDHDFVKRASKIKPLRVLESTYISVSVRRLEKEGRLPLLQKYFQVYFYRKFKGEIRDDVVEYEFGNFGKVKTEI